MIKNLFQLVGFLSMTTFVGIWWRKRQVQRMRQPAPSASSLIHPPIETIQNGSDHTKQRLIPLTSVPNFRDIGGYPTADGQTVRYERIYRSSAFDQVTPTDVATLHEMGIRAVCDVRTQEEQNTNPNQLPDVITVHRIPPHSDDNRWIVLMRLLFQTGFLEHTFLRDLYMRVMIDENPQVFARIFSLLADSDNLPLVIHCALGKDRTGISIALLLAVLGVPDTMIVADYALSNQHYDFFKRTTQQTRAQFRQIGFADHDFDHLLIADGALIQETLDYIQKRYGSVRQYLIDHAGIDPTMLDALHQHLLI
ncbi:MAG: tyrosine-protein phosphatase [Anaerolineae bacterium]